MGFVERSTWLRLLNPQTHCEMLTFFPTFPQTASLSSGQAGSITARTPCANGAKRVTFSRRGKKCSACKFSVVRFQARSGSSRQSFQGAVFSLATARRGALTAARGHRGGEENGERRAGHSKLCGFLPAYPNSSGVGTPNGKSRFLVRVTFEIRRNDKSNTREVGPISRRVSRDESVAADFRMRSDVEIR